MTGREFLEKARRCSEALAGLRAELEYQTASVTGCSPAPYDAVHTTGGEQNRFESELIMYIDNSDKIRERIDRANRTIEKCERLIDMMPNGRYQTLVRMKYLAGCSWTSVARELGVKRETAMNHYKIDALRMFCDAYEIIKIRSKNGVI